MHPKKKASPAHAEEPANFAQGIGPPSIEEARKVWISPVIGLSASAVRTSEPPGRGPAALASTVVSVDAGAAIAGRLVAAAGSPWTCM